MIAIATKGNRQPSQSMKMNFPIAVRTTAAISGILLLFEMDNVVMDFFPQATNDTGYNLS